LSSYFNDSPIEVVEDDRYGITPFAKSLARSILGIKKPIGTTLALSGPWGSGKSSAVNLIRSELANSNSETLVVTDFKCWWYRGEDALALAFLQNLNGVLRDSLGDKVKDLIPSMTRHLLQAGPVIGQAISLATGQAWASALMPGASKFVGAFFPKGDTLEKTFRKLAHVLEAEERRFLVIIDDIDRLSPDEALAIFRLVKSIGRLPNVLYLLVFDRELADKAVEQRYPSEGPHFLEKIIQAGFELPQPLQTDLNGALLTSVQTICGEPDEKQVRRIMNLFYDVVAPYITTPRHVARFENAISVTWPAIAREIDLADFLALETLRLYEPGLFKAIRLRKSMVCGVRHQGDHDARDEARFDPFLSDVPVSRHDTAKVALQRLFPRLETMGYGSEFIRDWDMERRVCVDSHFDTYFRLSLGEETLPTAHIDNLIQHADDGPFIQEVFRGAAATERKNGNTMVPVFLDELTTHSTRIPPEKVGQLLAALFAIHDEMDLECDAGKGFDAIANTSNRFYWLMRALTRRRFTLEERSAMYLAALEHASLGWLVYFTDSARENYNPRDGHEVREEDRLVTEDAVALLTERSLAGIRAAAENGSLLHHRDLMALLYSWRDFMSMDASEVRTWTDALLHNDQALVVFAKAMTRQSWSAGMGGFGSLGDRVATPTTQAQVNENTDILDLLAFRNGLERIVRENALDEDSVQTVQTFLDAWKRGNRRRDD
jgi:predicted KAP-like P-loop ATPase